MLHLCLGLSLKTLCIEIPVCLFGLLKLQTICKHSFIFVVREFYNVPSVAKMLPNDQVLKRPPPHPPHRHNTSLLALSTALGTGLDARLWLLHCNHTISYITSVHSCLWKVSQAISTRNSCRVSFPWLDTRYTRFGPPLTVDRSEVCSHSMSQVCSNWTLCCSFVQFSCGMCRGNWQSTRYVS